MATTENTNMDPRVALQNFMVAITGADPVSSGILLGSYQQHEVLQRSAETLQRLIAASENDAAAT